MAGVDPPSLNDILASGLRALVVNERFRGIAQLEPLSDHEWFNARLVDSGFKGNLLKDVAESDQLPHLRMP